MYYLIYERDFKDSAQGQQILEGLSLEFRKKRKRLVYAENSAVVKPGDIVFVMGIAITWIDGILAALNQKGISPVLLSANGNEFEGRSAYSVYVDEQSLMRSVMGEIQERIGTQIALFGADLNNAGDRKKGEVLIECGAWDEAIYYNHGSIQKCFMAFHTEMFRYQAVIAANSTAAVYLLRMMTAEERKKIKIISYTDSAIFRFRKEGIIVVDYDYSEVGTIGFMVAERMQKDPRIGDVVIKARWAMDSRVVPRYHFGPIVRRTIVQNREEDPELQRIYRLEEFLNVIDELDEKIIRALLERKTNDEISEETFLTVSAVKYRVKKIEKLCGCKGKNELCLLLGEFLLG